VALVAVASKTALAGGSAAGPLVQVSGASLFGAACGNVPGSPAGTNSVGSEVEPWIDVSPANPAVMAGAWQQDRWSNGGARGLVASVSLDGGATWQAPSPIPGVSQCSGGTFSRATDPWVAFGADGDLYQISLSIDVDPATGTPGGFGPNALLVSKVESADVTDDGGIASGEWTTPISIIQDSNPRFLSDKESITAHPTNPNFVYAVWDRLKQSTGDVINPERVPGNLAFKAAAMFSRTTDGGATWESPRVVYDPGGISQTIGNQLLVLPDGTLVSVFNEILGASQSAGPGPFNLSLKRSSDNGTTWLPRGRPIRAAKLLPRTLFTPPPFIGVYDPDDPTQPIRAADVLFDVAVGPIGQLYAVWQDSRFSNNGTFSDPALLIDEIAFSQSLDGGLTWSAPIKVNQTPTGIALANRQAFVPSIDVAADGTVGVTYYDFRNNTTAAGALTDHFIVHCHATCTSAANWGNEVGLTTASFDITQAPLTGSGFFLGDYVGLASSGNDFVALFAQAGSASDPSSIYSRRVSTGT
jgi:hypothetical protein